MRKQYYILLFILLVALLPRLYKLTTLTPIIVDEPAYLRDIALLLHTSHVIPAQMQWDFSQATLVYYPTIFLIKAGITNQLLALRLTSVICSLLLLVPFFFIVKRYTSLFVASCTTVLLSYSYFFLQFSRVGWGVIYATTFGLYGIWCVLSLNEKNSKYMAILAGIFSSITFYSYRAGEVYICIILVYFFYNIFRLQKGIFYKVFLSFCFLGSFLFFSFPWMQTIFANMDKFRLREHVVSIFGTDLPYHNLTNFRDILFYQVTTTIKAWIFLWPTQGGGLEDPRYLPGMLPPISPGLIPFYFVGFVLAWKRIKQFWMWISVLIGGLIFGQILTINPPNGARGLILLPVLYLFCALGMFATINKYRYGKTVTLLLLSFTAIVALSDWAFYLYWMSWIKV